MVGGLRFDCEVFDSTSNKFVLLKELKQGIRENLPFPAEVVSIGTKLVVFSNQDKVVMFYDVKNEVWSSNTLGVQKTIRSFACTKVPQF